MGSSRPMSRKLCLAFLFNNSHLTYLPKIFSDHSPMILNFSHSISTSPKIFKFENVWLENADFIAAIKKALYFQPYFIPIHGFYHIIARIIAHIKFCKQYSFSALERDLKNLEGQIKAFDVNDLNNNPSDPLIVRSLHYNYRALLR